MILLDNYSGQWLDVPCARKYKALLYTWLLQHLNMANAQVRVQLIPHARDHYLAVANYRYFAKTR